MLASIHVSKDLWQMQTAGRKLTGTRVTDKIRYERVIPIKSGYFVQIPSIRQLKSLIYKCFAALNPADLMTSWSQTFQPNAFYDYLV